MELNKMNLLKISQNARSGQKTDFDKKTERETERILKNCLRAAKSARTSLTMEKPKHMYSVSLELQNRGFSVAYQDNFYTVSWKA